MMRIKTDAPSFTTAVPQWRGGGKRDTSWIIRVADGWKPHEEEEEGHSHVIMLQPVHSLSRLEYVIDNPV